jgi:hypothetical protein
LKETDSHSSIEEPIRVKRILSGPIRTREYPIDDLDFFKKNLRLKKIHIILLKKRKKRKRLLSCHAAHVIYL